MKKTVIGLLCVSVLAVMGCQYGSEIYTGEGKNAAQEEKPVVGRDEPLGGFWKSGDVEVEFKGGEFTVYWRDDAVQTGLYAVYGNTVVIKTVDYPLEPPFPGYGGWWFAVPEGSQEPHIALAAFFLIDDNFIVEWNGGIQTFTQNKG